MVDGYGHIYSKKIGIEGCIYVRKIGFFLKKHLSNTCGMNYRK